MSAHLLAAALLITTLSVFAQDKTATSPDSSPTTDSRKISQNVAEEPWNLFAKPFQLDSRIDRLLVAPDGQFVDDTLCYKIRSYVVARDRKDSDSVHPVGYSTCQPASRYRMRTTELRISSSR